MKIILLLIVAPFVFLSVLSSQTTREVAYEIVLEHMSRETRPYTLYAKEGIQKSITITSSAGEILELDYSCWVHYIRFAEQAGSGCYCIVKESNGNVLEISAANDDGPGENDDTYQNVTGYVTGYVIGSYYNGFASVLVQVDEKYPIGETIEHPILGDCLSMPDDGTYPNMIQVQGYFPIREMMNKKIFFSYRTYQQEGDSALFTAGSGIIIYPLCGGPPTVPIYVMTDCQILN